MLIHTNGVIPIVTKPIIPLPLYYLRIVQLTLSSRYTVDTFLLQENAEQELQLWACNK